MKSKNRDSGICRIFILIFCVSIIGISIITGSLFVNYKFDFAKGHFYLSFLQKICLIFIFITTINLIYRIVFALYYRSFSNGNGSDSNELPSISVIIPVYNEGQFVTKTIESVLSSDYTKGRMQVIIVDDGSKDDTKEWLKNIGKKQYLEIYTHNENKGKRIAIQTGISHSRGDIIITVDSDTILDKKAVSEIIKPFLSDKSIGAVTGCVKAYNHSRNWLTRIVSARYALSFDIFRASQSVFKSVMCCSGVLSAYKKEIFIEVMPDWLSQEFLGKKCTYGDDRALTNLILKKGYYTVYQRTAVAYTCIPENITKLFKMLNRWNKSYIRENLIFTKFAFKKYRKNYRFMPIWDFFISNSILLIQYFILPILIYQFVINPIFILRYASIIIITYFIYIALYFRISKDFNIVYGLISPVLHIFFNMWIFPYALFNLKETKWGTR